MKNLLILLIVIATIFPSCKKSSKTTSYMNTGEITGPDYGMTYCSGGYFIKVDGVSGPIRFNTLPASSGIDLTTSTFPINVKLNWHYQTTPDPCGIIVVDAIAKVD